MSIKIQVEDAIFLIENGRYLGALTNLMLAVAASSRKTFPKPAARSYKNPNDSMRDNEAFRVFLSRGVRKLLFGDYQEGNSEDIGICVNFRNCQIDLAEILYKYYRCELVHEGELPSDVAFSKPVDGHSGISLSISSDGHNFILDYNLLNILIKVVVTAPCNRDLFGAQSTELSPKNNESEDDISQRIVSNWDLTPGRFAILKEVVRNLLPEQIQKANDTEIKNGFSELVRSGVINGSAIEGLAIYQLSTNEGALEQKGLEVIREIANSYSS